MSSITPHPPPQPPAPPTASIDPYETVESISHRRQFQDLKNIIPLNEWILYDDYLKVWENIWEFIEEKRRTGSVYINNFAYNYMSTKEFYFSWKQKSEMIGDKLVKHCMFDYLDINHEDIRRLRRRMEDSD